MNRPRPKHTIGPDVARWIERLCVHGPGDVLGKPVTLTPDEKRFLSWAYEVDENGRKVIGRAVRGLPKGSRKTEFAAWVALAELAGPCRFDRFDDSTGKAQARGTQAHDPYVVAAASTYEQADLLFAAARAAITEGPLKDFFECFDKEIQRKGAPGVLVRVPAVAGANDGLRPTFVVMDETHEWTGNKQRVALVLENGLAKRRDAWSLQITTAGSPKVDSVALATYRYGRRVEQGEIDDPAFLFTWREPSVTVDKLADREILARTVAEVNPESWKDLATLIRRYNEIPLHEFCRYHLNLWIEPDEERWLPPGLWESLVDPREVPDGTKIVLGFDGSYSGDSTALIGATVEESPHLFVLGLWEHPGTGQQWIVDHDDVEARVHHAFRRFQVAEMSADPPYWGQQLTRWAEQYGEDRVLAYNTFVRKRMAAAVSAFYQAASVGTLSHDGDPSLARHVQNATLKETSAGAYITKPPGSPLKIDAAIASVIAYNRAYWHATNRPQNVSAGVLIV